MIVAWPSVGALAHLDIRHDKAHGAGFVDADEGVRRERRIAIGRRRRGEAVHF
jgi:hypothetical protein